MRSFYFPNGETLCVDTDSKGAAVQALAPLGTVMDSYMHQMWQERAVCGWIDVSSDDAKVYITRFKRGLERRQAAEAVRKAGGGVRFNMASRAILRKA